MFENKGQLFSIGKKLLSPVSFFKKKKQSYHQFVGTTFLDVLSLFQPLFV